MMSLIAEMLQSASGQEQYQRWREDPVTMRFLAEIRRQGRPRRPALGGGMEDAYMVLGESLGWNGAADLMENPLAFSPKVAPTPEPSYGAGGLLSTTQIVDEGGEDA
jgi:hypothetical protein